MKPTKPTSRDIAYEAGVSQATVSRALRNSPLVRPETRQKIADIAAQLNYRVDKHAAGLRTRQSRTLALLLFEDPTSDDSQINPFFLAMLGNITRAAASLDYDVLVSFQQLSDHWHARYEASHRADGIILLGYGDYVTYAEKLQALADANAHFIIWGPMVDELPGHSLGCDNIGGALRATQHLIELGRTRIAFLGGASEHCPEFEHRHRGYRQALAAAGLSINPELRVDADNQENSGHAAAALLLAGREFDGIFAASDLIAIGAMRSLQEAGLHVPGDVSVVGFDDIPAASYVNPGLTTVHQDTVRAGEMLVKNLIKLIEGEPVESLLLPPKLVVRQSCGGRR
ncbi:MAG: LacI family DNA-binding transcriptional regulator [Woeseiaceae bacterium]